MNAEQLLTHFDRIADAPDAIPRLRRFILDLAVRGKLVEQDPTDEPASELLKQIAEGKKRLIETEAIRKPKVLASVSTSEVPFCLPGLWTWTRTDDLSPWSLTDGDWIETKNQSENGRVRLIQLADIGDGSFLNKSARFITEETERRLNCTRLEAGDVLIARLPNPIGRACIFPDIGQPAITAVDVAILRLDSNLNRNFVALALNAPTTRRQVEAYGKGTTRFRVSTGHLKTILIPIPPLAEQHRIVAKVDELMALCDRLETARREREATRDRLTAASLARLNAPDPGPAVFQNHAAFALNNLTPLTTRPDQIKALRQTVLNLAVRGKLVEQDPSDEPVSELLKRIAAEKARLVKAEKIRKRKTSEPAPPDSLAFELPGGWAVANFSDVLAELQTGPFGSSLHQNDYEMGGTPVINPASMRDGKIVPVEKMAVGADTLERLATFKLQAGDIVMGRRGEMGRCAVVTEQEDGWLCGTGSLILRPPQCLYPEYLAMLIGSPYVREYLGGFAVGATMQNLNQSILLKMRIGLPPLAEQHRVVAKVDELMALCDRLEASLDTGEDIHCRLLNVLLHEALGPGGNCPELVG